MIFPVNLKVLSQMLDPAGKKCDLHICTAGIFVMQLELLEVRRLVALSHNEGPIVDEESIFATAQPAFASKRNGFPVCRRTKGSAFRANGLPGGHERLRQRIWAENLSRDTYVIFGLT